MTRPTREFRAATDVAPEVDGRRLSGQILYGVRSAPLPPDRSSLRHTNGPWVEVMEPGCLRGADLSNLHAYVGHSGVPLGRHPDTLEVSDGPEALSWSLELPESRSDVREAVERRDLRGCSFGFRVAPGGERWEGNVRHVTRVAELFDVSVLPQGQYAEARVDYRHFDPADDAEEAPDVTRPATHVGLRVEDRAAVASGSPAERVRAAIASVPRGELRDLTRATAAPVEPDDLRTVLIDKFREVSVMSAAGVPIISTDSAVVRSPMLTGDVTAAFYDELEEIDESDPTFDDFEVPVKALKTLVRASSESIEDSDPSLLQILQDNVTTALALKGDRELVAGSDPKGFKGLTKLAGVQTYAVNGALTWDHIVRAVGRLGELHIPGAAAVLMPPQVAVALDITKEDSSSNVYLGRPDGLPPVFQTSWLPVTGGQTPTTTVAVFVPTQAQIVLRKAVQVEVDRSQEFSSDAVLVRGRYRLGFGIPHPQSVILLTGVTAPSILPTA